MSKHLIKGLLFTLTLGFVQVSTAGYVGDPIATDAPYDMNYYPEETTPPASSNISLYPSQMGYEFLGPMSFHQGGGHAKLQTAYLYAHLIKQDNDAKFSMGLDMITRMTWFSVKNNDIFESERLYTFGLNVNGTYAFSEPTKLFFGASALMATDFDVFNSHCIQIGARAGVSHRVNDRLSLQLGVYYSPQIAACPVLPIIGFRYVVNDDWFVQLDALRLRAVNKINDTISWGPFVGLSAGSWNVRHDRRDMRLAYTSGVAGLQANFALGNWGEYTPTLTTEVGFTFANNFQYRNSTGRDKISSSNTDAGMYVQIGLKTEF